MTRATSSRPGHCTPRAGLHSRARPRLRGRAYTSARSCEIGVTDDFSDPRPRESLSVEKRDATVTEIVRENDAIPAAVQARESRYESIRSESSEDSTIGNPVVSGAERDDGGEDLRRWVTQPRPGPRWQRSGSSSTESTSSSPSSPTLSPSRQDEEREAIAGGRSSWTTRTSSAVGGVSSRFSSRGSFTRLSRAAFGWNPRWSRIIARTETVSGPSVFVVPRP